MQKTNHHNFKSYIKNEFIKKGKKLRGKHAPISEVIDDVPKSLSVEKVYKLREVNKYYFLIVVRNYSKHPKFRYFLAISIANSSSDLLVQLAREYAIQYNLKLIQYSIYPKTLRIQLLLLKEIEKIEDYNNFVEKLSDIRKEFRRKLIKIKNLVENE
ncbi:MAG: hypothetical protein ACFE9M_07950 [Promethearchaeota archaeon]